MNHLLKIVAALSLVVMTSPVCAEVLYQSTAAGSNLGYFPSDKNDAGYYELGDEVNLAVAESTTPISNVSFDYYAEVPSGQSRTAVLRVYSVNGADWDIGPKIIRTPGAPLFESEPFVISSGTYTVNVPVPNLTVPSTMVWGVEFRGFTQNTGDRIALYATDASSPIIGSSFNDFWENFSGTGWALLSTPPHKANFVSKISR